MKEAIDEYFETHPSINVFGVEREAGLPARTLHNYLKGHKPLPEKHLPAIVEVLERYGLNSTKVSNDIKIELKYRNTLLEEQNKILKDRSK